MNCTICFEPTNTNQHLFFCSHIFHEMCIINWKKTCPNCRSLRKFNTPDPWQLNVNCFDNVFFVTDFTFLRIIKYYPEIINNFHTCIENDHKLFFGQQKLSPYKGCISCITCKTFELTKPIYI